METAIGVFDSRDKAEIALRELLTRKIPQEAMMFLTRSETEAGNFCKELGTWAGGLLGGTVGMTAGVFTATVLTSTGLVAGMTLCIGTTALLAFAGAVAGSAVAKELAKRTDIPCVTYDHEDAGPFHNLLKDGQSLVIVRTPWRDVAAVACEILDRAGAGIQQQRTSLESQCMTRMVADVNVVDIKGVLTLAEGNAMLREIIEGLTQKEIKKIVLNLADLERVDSAGIGELVRSHTTVRKTGGSMKLAAANPRLDQNFKMTSLHSVFDIYPDEASAIRSFAKVAAAGA
jgi:anti-sigma B factor antagonist